MTEVRTHPVIGTRYVEHALYLNDKLVHKQLSPYSEHEIHDRIRAFLHPKATPDFKVTNFRSKPGKKPKDYVWRTGVNED